MDIFSPTPTSLAPGAERLSTRADHRRGLLFVSAVCRRVVSMRGSGKLGIGLLAIVALLALTATSALAATPISVTETTDAPLESGAITCESTDIGKGCTLRAAVELADATGGEVTIDVPEGTYRETVAQPTLVVEGDAEVTISGAGAEKTIIEGEAKAGVLEVKEDSSLTIDGVTVTNGEDEFGGGIYVAPLAHLTVENSTITENLATVDGGGIYGEFLSQIAVKRSTITENYGDGDGGGIYVEFGAYVSVAESEITHNHVNEYGGGISSEPDSVVVVERSTIANNIAEEGGGGVETYTTEDICVGAVGARAAAHASRARRAVSGDEPEVGLTVDQSTIEHNSARLGGGVYTFQLLGDECDVHGASRKAATPAAHKSARHELSLLELEPSLVIDQSTIAYNRAEEIDEDGGYGGGIYEEGDFDDPIINSTIADNFATNDGGGVAIADGASLALVSDTVFDNTVEPAQLVSDGKSVRRALHGDVAEGAVGPGNNLATEEGGDDYAVLRNTIVAEPNASLQNCEGYLGSLVEHAGYNLDYPSTAEPVGTLDSCGMSAEENDLVGTPPGLNEDEGLANNGGPTQTIALLSTSPAIGFVPLTEDCDEPVFGPAGVDQRGEKRPGIAGKGCDIGAYEYQEPPKQAEAKTEEKAPAPPVGVTSVLSVKIVSPEQCASKRDIKIHIQNVKQFGIVSAVVSVDGHHKRTLTGGHLSTAIDLRGLPTGTFTVEIVAHTRSGHTLRGKRVYHTCHTKLPGQSDLRL
jgi:hypothetical protein